MYPNTNYSFGHFKLFIRSICSYFFCKLSLFLFEFCIVLFSCFNLFTLTIIVPVQLILSFKYIKDVTVLYKSRTYYKLLTDEHNAEELAKMIYDNVSRTVYKVNCESYMKNRLHKRYLIHNNEIVLIAFGDCDDLSKVPMTITEQIRMPKIMGKLL